MNQLCSKRKQHIQWITFLYVFLAFISTTTLVSQENTYKSPIQQHVSDKVNGLSWVGNDSIVLSNFESVHYISADWISLTTYGWMNHHQDPHVENEPKKDWWGDTNAGVIHTAQIAHQAGTKVMLKPHLIMPRGTKYWRHDIKMRNNEDWDLWFKNYERWILEYAQIAADNNIEMLCIGTELYKTTSKHPERWEQIIKEIRKIYNGQLTYAANWYREVKSISFWDQLDYIGVQAYYPLSKESHVTKDKLTNSWNKRIKQLDKISKKYNRKILFTEIGYKNTMDAAATPWEWPQDLESETQISGMTQKLCYEAYFETIWQQPWFGGGFIWNWHHTTYKVSNLDSYWKIRAEQFKLWSSQVGQKIPSEIHFSPQGQAAEEVLLKYYKELD